MATISNALSHTTTFSYDAQNNLTSITDPLSAQTTRAYDGYGRLIRVASTLSRTVVEKVGLSAIKKQCRNR